MRARKVKVLCQALAFAFTVGSAVSFSGAEEATRLPLCLRLELFRTDVIPYEPLLVTCEIQNLSKDQAVKVNWDSGLYVWVEYRASTGWETLHPRDLAPNRIPPPPVTLAPGKSLSVHKSLLPIAWRQGQPPVFTPGKWLLRAFFRLQDDTELRSEPITLNVIAPEGLHEYDAYWRLCQSVRPKPNFDSLALYLVPRSEIGDPYPQKLEAQIREMMRNFVASFPESRYSTYFRYTFVALQNKSYTPDEVAICDEYREHLLKDPDSSLNFPEYMRPVFAPAK
ncbi:MAG: hypothetical protein A3K18_10140 [Lentisphaerae bacterium RIFOXYA12_64_32]|nr:MAG: hypothetical protein A3K18_10140 [Lentisphaerae bacterium RIFOXYA12_64_32]